MATDETPELCPATTRLRVARVLAWLALALLTASALLFTLPVSNPGVQNCGSPGWYLLTATSNAALYTDSGEPINGWSQARLRLAAAHQCSSRVAARAVPGAILLAAFWLLAIVAVVLGVTDRRRLRQSRREQAAKASLSPVERS